ncbi:MAG: integrase catalytic domain-containing protein [Leucobacter sp.]
MPDAGVEDPLALVATTLAVTAPGASPVATQKVPVVVQLTASCVHTGWTHLEVLRNNARVHMLAALDRLQGALPFGIAGLDCDNGSEFVNNEVVNWAGERSISSTRSRPHKKNDQAVVESKTNHIVRTYGFYRTGGNDRQAA